MHSHFDGEVWGLCVVSEKGYFLTAGDDNKILLYDVHERKCISKGTVQVEGANTS